MQRHYEMYTFHNNNVICDDSGFMAEVKDIKAWENGEIGEYFFNAAMTYEYNYKDGTFCIHDGIGIELEDPKCVYLLTKRQAEDFERDGNDLDEPIYKTENMEDGKLYLTEEHFDISDNRPNRAWIVRNGKDITDYLNGKTDNLVKADILNI